MKNNRNTKKKSRSAGYNPQGAYYYRVMSSQLETEILTNYKWLIDFVKDHECLDFQTGFNNGKSWFSIYRGTGRILTLSQRENGKLKISVANAYQKILPDITNEKKLNKDLFEKYIQGIEKTSELGRYYVNAKSEKKEGYYQNLIARRYTLNLKSEDDFVIIDKELVIGFESDTFKRKWNNQIIEEQKEKIKQTREALSGTRLPTNIKSEYGEFDFLAIDKQGNFIIMELKQDDAEKTYLSPVQVNYYVLQFEKLLKEKKEEICDAIRKMFNQKVRMGLIKSGWTLPENFKCEVHSFLIVGTTKGLSKEICRRFRGFRRGVLPSITAFETNDDGTIKYCSKLNKTEYALSQEKRLNGSKYYDQAHRDLNLYQLDIKKYMDDNKIEWWQPSKNGNFISEKSQVPTHKLSSQVACLNHLFAIRNNPSAVLSLIQTIGTPLGVHFDSVLQSFNNDVEKGYITFEFVYNNIELLREKHETRGKKCTSVDALIYAKAGNEYWLIPIEWKYTEAYDTAGFEWNFDRYHKCFSSKSRLKIWNDLFRRNPFYELGRQTLLMEKIIESKKIKADHFLHLIVVPKGNIEMREDVQKFKESLKIDAQKYCQCIDPRELFTPLTKIVDENDTRFPELVEVKDLITYLKARYWE